MRWMGEINMALRKRLRAWVRYFWVTRYERQGKTQDSMAYDMDISAATLSNAMSASRTIGLDVFVAVHQTFHVTADQLIHTDPPAFDAPPGHGATLLPSPASGSAQPRRRARRGA